jgi:hypothetical protein
MALGTNHETIDLPQRGACALERGWVLRADAVKPIQPTGTKPSSLGIGTLSNPCHGRRGVCVILRLVVAPRVVGRPTSQF